MTYAQLKKEFFETNRQKIRYVHNGKTVILVKHALADMVWAIYMALIEHEPESGKEQLCRKQIAGYLNSKGEFVYPSKEFLENAIRPDKHFKVSDPRIDVRNILRDVVLQLARKMPKPELTPEDAAEVYKFAEAWVYAGFADADKAYCDFGPSCAWMFLNPCECIEPAVFSRRMCMYIQKQGVVDLLSNKPDWAAKTAKEWLRTQLPGADIRGQIRKTYGDILVYNLAITDAVLSQVSALCRDKAAPVHVYIAMKNATASVRRKSVEVEYVMKDGRTGKGEIPAEYFQYSPMQEDVSKISLSMAKTPTKRILLKQLLPKNARWLKKDDIVAIRYNGRVLWESPVEKMLREPEFAACAV